jgi:hypothetical protein
MQYHSKRKRMRLKLIIKPGTYDRYLMIITALILAVIGLICLYSIWYYTSVDRITPGWTGTGLFEDYIDSMNHLVYPFIILLLVVLGLCIPKRIIPRQWLLSAGSCILGLTIITALVADIKTSMVFLLFLSIVFQTVIMILTVLRWHGLSYEREGYLIRTGSSMLHLGVVIFIFDFVSMRTSDYHIDVFWIATVLITAGTILSFYPGEIGAVLMYGRKGSNQ